jgi:hypothetical protein
MPLTDEAAALTHHLIAGGEKVFTNAEALYSEATILANSSVVFGLASTTRFRSWCASGWPTQ